MNLLKSLRNAGRSFLRSVHETVRRVAETGNPSRLVINPPPSAVAAAVVGSMRRAQPRLSGLEIRAVRKTKRSLLTGRSCRSKYMPDGIPARTTKLQRQMKLAFA